MYFRIRTCSKIVRLTAAVRSDLTHLSEDWRSSSLGLLEVVHVVRFYHLVDVVAHGSSSTYRDLHGRPSVPSS